MEMVEVVVLIHHRVLMTALVGLVEVMHLRVRMGSDQHGEDKTLVLLMVVMLRDLLTLLHLFLVEEVVQVDRYTGHRQRLQGAVVARVEA
jgi:hypothetical protein